MPRESGTPSFAYSAAPSSMIGGIVAIVSTLLTTVGEPYRPAIAGNGGFVRGWPRLPSSDSSSAVSSPQMYAPAPRCTTIVTPPRTSSRAPSSSSARWSSSIIGVSIALRTSGRFSVTCAIAPSTETTMLVVLMRGEATHA